MLCVHFFNVVPVRVTIDVTVYESVAHTLLHLSAFASYFIQYITTVPDL